MGAAFTLLGPITAESGGRQLDLGYPKQRHILAVLLLSPNRVVGTDDLIDRVWGDDPSDSVRATLHSYLSRLRGTLAGAGVELVRAQGGYSVSVDEADIDVHRFRRLVAEARTVPDEVAAARLDEALDLWRGSPLAGLETLWAVAVRTGLAGERLAARLDRTDARLRLGQHTGLLGDLSADTEAHPLNERLASQYLLALHRNGRTSDALAHFRALTRRLADELGSAPGPELRSLHERILRADPVLAAQPVAAAAPSSPVPRQLPPTPRSFTGRARALAALDDGGGLVAVITGPGGIGKSSLAIEWAHQHLDRFPDGQLYVNLRGFDRSAPVTVGAAVRGFLDALGVAPGSVPADLDTQIGLYRSLVAGRRLLVVLDNAADTAHVNALLPGSPGGTALVTSRRPLLGLVATQGARSVRLGLLSDAESRDLLAGHLGADRLAEEPEATTALVDRCGGLPLALGIVAARAATRPDFPLATLADELRDLGRALDALDLGEAELSLRTVFSWSYRTLGEQAARLFRLLGLHPGPDVGRGAAASLLGVPVPEARRALTELTDGHLLTEHAPGRFTLHDLLRAYACELTAATDTDADRDPAVRRLLDHYVHTAHAAALLLSPHRHPIDLAPPAPGTTPTPPHTYDEALTWFHTEQALLRTAVTDAARAGYPTHAWQLAWAQADFLSHNGNWQDLHDTQRAALSAATEAGDIAGQANAHQSLAQAHLGLGNPDEAHEHEQQAATYYHQARPGGG